MGLPRFPTNFSLESESDVSTPRGSKMLDETSIPPALCNDLPISFRKSVFPHSTSVKAGKPGGLNRLKCKLPFFVVKIYGIGFRPANTPLLPLQKEGKQSKPNFSLLTSTNPFPIFQQITRRNIVFLTPDTPCIRL